MDLRSPSPDSQTDSEVRPTEVGSHQVLYETDNPSNLPRMTNDHALDAAFDPGPDYRWEEIPADTPAAILDAMGGPEANRIDARARGGPRDPRRHGRALADAGATRPGRWLAAARRRDASRPICRWAITTSIPRPAIGRRESSSRRGGASNPASLAGAGPCNFTARGRGKAGASATWPTCGGWPSGRPDLGPACCSSIRSVRPPPSCPRGPVPTIPPRGDFAIRSIFASKMFPGRERLGPQLARLAAEARGLNALPRLDRDRVFHLKQQALRAIWGGGAIGKSSPRPDSARQGVRAAVHRLSPRARSCRWNASPRFACWPRSSVPTGGSGRTNIAGPTTRPSRGSRPSIPARWAIMPGCNGCWIGN